MWQPVLPIALRTDCGKWPRGTEVRQNNQTKEQDSGLIGMLHDHQAT
jgi:hypothetical protein